MMKKRRPSTDSEPAAETVPHPADYPVGSPQSRAAARMLAKEKEPPEIVVETDDEGRLLWRRDKVYSSKGLAAFPRMLTEEEWVAKYGPGGTESLVTAEQHQERTRRWLEQYRNLAATIPKWVRFKRPIRK